MQDSSLKQAPNRDLTRILIPFVYFIAGAVSLAGVATTFFYKDDLGLTIPQVGMMGFVFTAAWSIKPLYGLLSDRQPIWKMRRKPYLVVSGLCGMIGYLSLATWVDSFSDAIIAVFISAMGFALADVIVDGVVAELSRSQAVAGKLQSICRAALLTGALIFAPLSGYLVSQIGARNVFFLTGVLPIFTVIFAFLMKEDEAEIIHFSLKETWQQFKGALNPGILFAALFIFIWRATPSSGGAFSFFLIDEYNFSPQFFGYLSLVSHAMGIVGVLIFRKYLLTIPLKKIFFWVMVLSVVLSLPSIALVYGWHEYLGMSPQLFSMADTLISAPLTEIGFLPLMVLIARVCPRGIEATMFAVLASLSNIGLAVSDLGGAWLTSLFNVRQSAHELGANYVHLDKVLWIAILSSFLPWPLLRFLPETRVEEELSDEVMPSSERMGVVPTEAGKSGIA